MNQSKQIVLVVDDSDLNRSFLNDMLEDEYQILEAADGIEAVEMLEQFNADIALVLLDVIMPRMDGFGVLKVMNDRKWISSIPVVLISSETSPDYIARGYELGVDDYINRPFDIRIVKRRVHNTIALYNKQKRLVATVNAQIKEKEMMNALMVNILSTIVEFRNGESGAHVLRIRIITEILLEALMERYSYYGLDALSVAEISNAAALHDVGKIVVPEEILNKPGRLTPEEFEIIKTHSSKGADMLQQIPMGKQSRMIQYACDICRWHHERWDGRGYPDGLTGEDIPIWAQAVSIADVYDALVSVRVYKPAYSHDKAMQMILNGECGTFNPRLMECLISEAGTLEEKIKHVSEDQDRLFDIQKLSEDAVSHNHPRVSDRSIYLLEQERTKYQFFASLSNEILFDYDSQLDTVTFFGRDVKTMGLPERIAKVKEACQSFGGMRPGDTEDLKQLVRSTTPDNPIVQKKYLLDMVNHEKHWHEITIRTLWANQEEPQYTGCIGKLVDINKQIVEISELKRRAERDDLTGLYNQMTARVLGKAVLQKRSNQNAAVLFLDVDNFKQTNDSCGHLYGDYVLKYIADTINQNIRSQDIAARVGGDEFLILLTGLPGTGGVEQQATRVLNALNAGVEGHEVSVSIGIALYPKDGTTFEELLHRADQALYLAKRKGKKRMAFYSQECAGEAFPTMLSVPDQPEFGTGGEK